MADDAPHHSSSTDDSASTSDGSSSSPASPPPAPPPPAAPPAPTPPLPLAAVVTPLPPPFPPASIATAIPLPHQHHQQLLQQYQQQLHQQQQQQRLFSFHLSPAAVAPPVPLPLKHPLPPLSSASPAPGFVSGGNTPAADRHSRDDCWSEGATLSLIHAWGDRYLELNRGNLKQKHWKDVADSVNRRSDGSKPQKTDIQCKNRLDTLKKKYKLEKSKIVTGGGPSKWPFFDRLDELIGPSKKPKKPLPVKLRPSLPLLPAPVLALPLKRPPEEVDQIQPPPLAPNHSASPAANHVTTNHAGSSHNQVGGAPNHVGSALNHVSSNPNHGCSAPNHTGSAPNHVASAVDAVSKSKESPRSADSCPNGEIARPKHLKRKRPHVDPMQELAQAITKFGEVYEKTEITRQQTLTEIEKQRMIFMKDLELQRLQFFAQTQVELAKLRNSCKPGNTDHM